MTYTKQTWTDEELADVALYDIKESDDTPINEGVKIELATDVIIAGSGVTAERMGHMEDGIYDAHTDIAALTTKVNDANDLKTTGGSSTAYTITTTGAAALVTGEAFLVKFHTTAGATPTLNRDGLGAKSIKYYDATGTKQAATSLQIITNMILTILYDGTDYVILGGGSSNSSSSSDGWQDGTGTWSYSSADSPNFVMSVPDADAALMNVGTRIKLTQTTVKYFGVQSIGTPSGGFTPVTIFGGTDYTLANAAITSPSWSNEKAPVGFPMSPLKWQVKASSTELKSKSSPTVNTWYGGANAFTSGSNQSIDVPIGAWRVTKKCLSQCLTNASAADADIFSTLSTSNNSESDSEFTTYVRNGGASGTLLAIGFSSVTKILVVTTKTTYYHLIKWQNATSANTISFRGDIAPTQIILDWAYL